LKRLDEFAKRRGDVELRPDTISYNAVLDAWAKSGDPAAPERAEAILIHMLKLLTKECESQARCVLLQHCD
jgi:hypothetical protein